MQTSTDRQAAADWWSTRIIEMRPGAIQFHGHPIQDLIGRTSFAGMIWLMLRGTPPTPGQETLFNAALMASVDHGPQAPSIAIARMAASCGVGINNAMASAANVLGDVHGGAGEQCVALLQDVVARQADAGQLLEAAAADVLDGFLAAGGKYVPGFGHRFHPVDPRSAPLLALLDAAEAQGSVLPGYAAAVRALEAAIAARKHKAIPINIDGATAAIYGALGFPPPLCRGLFVLSRSVGILAHAWEQMQRQERNKGPMPKGWLWRYTGEPAATLAGDA